MQKPIDVLGAIETLSGQLAELQVRVQNLELDGVDVEEMKERVKRLEALAAAAHTELREPGPTLNSSKGAKR